jgi:hypothetical protein
VVMAGKKGRSGRRRDTVVYTPTRWCGERLSVMVEFWLATEPQLKHTVPDSIKRPLARWIINDLFPVFYPNEEKPSVKAVLRWWRDHVPTASLRRRDR